MSTTRKIEGYLTAHDDNGPGYELGSGAGFGSFWEGDATKFLPEALPVTLVIGGKAYTEEEHEAEFQRRAKAMLVDLLKSQSSADVANGWQCGATADWSGIATRHGIKLP